MAIFSSSWSEKKLLSFIVGNLFVGIPREFLEYLICAWPPLPLFIKLSPKIYKFFGLSSHCFFEKNSLCIITLVLLGNSS